MGPSRNDWFPDLRLSHRRLHGQRCLCSNRRQHFLITGVFADAVTAALAAAAGAAIAAAATRIRRRQWLRYHFLIECVFADAVTAALAAAA